MIILCWTNEVYQPTSINYNLSVLAYFQVLFWSFIINPEVLIETYKFSVTPMETFIQR